MNIPGRTARHDARGRIAGSAAWSYGRLTALVISSIAIPTGLLAQQLKPETQRDFDCYVQAAETRMNAQKPFVRADSDGDLVARLANGERVETILANGKNPHKLAGGQLYDWIGTVFIPNVKLERLIRMLQDYDHRQRYFRETVSASKLLCQTGGHFGYTMTLMEPAVIDLESEVTWYKIDEHRWRCNSYSVNTHEPGKDHGYLRRLYSYWRFSEVQKGIYVEAETITLSDEFGSMARTIGSLMGINPEKSLKHSLASMRDSVMESGVTIPSLPVGLPACPAPYRIGACPSATDH